jgi:dihydrofolate synthase/folylpolyglutamate synthase
VRRTPTNTSPDRLVTPATNPSRPLADWLAHIERLHPRTIELGLERVQVVLDAMRLRQPRFAVITVAGTNGKGSTCAMLEACLRAAGYRVGLYTSPHLVRYNERVRVNGVEATDDDLCQAFEDIERSRGDTALTYFEFGTLAALRQFAQAAVEVAVLEVGMGGRLDAVNAVDADCAVVTTVDIDHAHWLGSTREAIGREKAGVYRTNRPAICGDADPPLSLLDHVAAIGARLFRIGRDFSFEVADGGWTFRIGGRIRSGLPFPRLRGEHQLHNAACALAALETLSDRLPVSQAQLREGLAQAFVAGRFQVLPGTPLRVLDVAHNPQAARVLAATLARQACDGRTLAVFGMLKDKDIEAVARALRDRIDVWHLAGLGGERGAGAGDIAAAIRAAGVSVPVHVHESAQAAHDAALREAAPADRVVIFGSFYMVGDILARAT